MKKYCCEYFSLYHQLNKETGYNIRVVKFTSTKFNQSSVSFSIEDKVKVIKGSHIPFRFFITNGYHDFSMLLPNILINFCPFCGQNLYELYGKDEYVNEMEGKTFNYN